MRKHPVELRVARCDIRLAPSPTERIDLLDGGPIDANWIAELTDLAMTNRTAIDRLPARSMFSMLQMMQHLGRLTSWAQANLVEWMAAFARPGVAVPVGDVLDAAMSATSDMRVHESHPGQPTEDDRQARAYASTSVHGDPLWDGIVASHAARIAAAEVGAVLHLAPITARGRVAEALTFVDDLPVTMNAWRDGRIDRVRAAIVAERTAVLDTAGIGAVEERILGPAAEQPAGMLTPGRLRAAVDRAVIEADPAAADRRAEQARSGRKVQVFSLDDDMARFAADLPAPIALLAKEVLDTAAKNLTRSCRVGRTLDQTRADLFGDIVVSLARNGHVDLRAGTSSAGHPSAGRNTRCESTSVTDDRGPRDGASFNADEADATESSLVVWKPLGTSVSVTIAASTLAGLDDVPGQLAGHGWITADLARALAVSARSARAVISRRTRCGPDQGDCSSGGTPEPEASGQRPLEQQALAEDRQCHQNCAEDLSPHSRWCGTELDYGRSVYRPPAALRELVMHRDRTCRFPGCQAPSQRCDLDHRQPFGETKDGGGATCACNLDALCRFHHRVKTFTEWSAFACREIGCSGCLPTDSRLRTSLSRPRWTVASPPTNFGRSQTASAP